MSFWGYKKYIPYFIQGEAPLVISRVLRTLNLDIRILN